MFNTLSIRKTLIIVILLILTITGCQSVGSLLTPSPNFSTTATSAIITPTKQNTVVETPIPTGSTATEVQIIVTGIGMSPITETVPARREILAVSAAELDAKRSFAQWQAGAQLESVTVVNQGMLETDIIKETVKATIHDIGNTIEQQYDNTTGTAVIKVEYVVDVAK